MTPPGERTGNAVYVLAAIPAGFLLVFFVLPILMLLSASVLKSDDMVPVAQFTAEHFTTLLSHKLYLGAVMRTLGIGIAVGALVIILGYPLAYVLARMHSRWQPLLVALALSPLLASVIVRTYGWWVLFNRDGAINGFLQAVGLTKAPLLNLTISLMSISIGFQGDFDSAYVMTQGGPDGATTTLGYYVFSHAFQWFNMGYAAAASVILFLLTLLATIARSL